MDTIVTPVDLVGPSFLLSIGSRILGGSVVEETRVWRERERVCVCERERERVYIFPRFLDKNSLLALMTVNIHSSGDSLL